METTNTVWEILTVTEDSSGSATNSGIYARLTGTIDGNPHTTIEQKLATSNHDDLESGQVDEYLLGFDTGSNFQLEKIIFRTDGNDAWKCKCVHVVEQATRKAYRHESRFELDEHNSYIAQLDEVTGVADKRKTDKFKVTVFTGSGNYDGTNDSVFIKLMSKEGFYSATHQLKTPIINDFEPGTAITYTIKTLIPFSQIVSVLLFKSGSNGWRPTQIKVADADLTSLTPVATTIGTNDIMIDGLKFLEIALHSQ
ncbi:PLAT/LH2 domain-containing protein [Vibrio jasicida]|uniref:PLAT/LH2 domain-containing protein n=1 Tax=Vibrio jasicida TaxID=766224 RepID=UPI000CE38053|nr:PLAT/LH2 domain-containing protein [Vibrio jasicida]